MEILQIVVLVLGLVLFTVSFFIPDKQTNTKEVREKEEQIFKELVEREIPDIRQKLNEEAEGIVESAKENTQRQMERLTNEKMMAINEYSDTVMSEIHKNHEEAVFLFDMLNNKHAQVKNTTAELSQVVKQSKQVQAAVAATAEKVAEAETKAVVEEPAFEPMVSKELEVIIPQELPTEEEIMQEVYAQEDFPKETPSYEEPAQDDDWHDTEEAEVVQKKKTSAPIYAGSDDYDDEYDYEDEYDDYNNVEIMFASENNEVTNNDRILELHKAGKSNMAIAKELGLGIGEVKLVIDLFKGGM